MDRRIVMGVLLFLIVIILIKSAKNNMGDSVKTTGCVNAVAVYNYIPLVPPSTVPVYTKFNFNDQYLTIADYTGVPLNISQSLKCAEDPTFYMIDRKYTIMTDCMILPEDKPESIIRITPALAYAMAGLGDGCPDSRNGKTPETIWGLWKDLPVIIIGRMFETTREVVDKLIQTYVDDDMSDQEIDYQFINDMKYVKSLPVNEKVDNSCRDMDARCPQWAKKNDCTLNPKYMLKQCAKSCGSCNYKEAEIDKLSQSFAKRDSAECSNHGGYSIGDR
jgi:hypothetical protein